MCIRYLHSSGIFLQKSCGCINGRAPEYLAKVCHPSVNRRPGMRSAVGGKLHVPRAQTSFGDTWQVVRHR